MHIIYVLMCLKQNDQSSSLNFAHAAHLFSDLSFHINSPEVNQTSGFQKFTHQQGLGKCCLTVILVYQEWCTFIRIRSETVISKKLLLKELSKREASWLLSYAMRRAWWTSFWKLFLGTKALTAIGKMEVKQSRKESSSQSLLKLGYWSGKKEVTSRKEVRRS